MDGSDFQKVNTYYVSQCVCYAHVPPTVSIQENDKMSIFILVLLFEVIEGLHSAGLACRLWVTGHRPGREKVHAPQSCSSVNLT